MITDSQSTIIKSTPKDVYMHIAQRGNKFPVFKLLDMRPFLALRLIGVGDLKKGFTILLKGNIYKKEGQERGRPLAIGDNYGPFKLIEAIDSHKYFFELKTNMFNLETGYTLTSHENDTLLSFDLISDDPTLLQRLYWRFPTKPLHQLLARKVVNELKKEIENASK